MITVDELHQQYEKLLDAREELSQTARVLFDREEKAAEALAAVRDELKTTLEAGRDSVDYFNAQRISLYLQLQAVNGLIWDSWASSFLSGERVYYLLECVNGARFDQDDVGEYWYLWQTPDIEKRNSKCRVTPFSECALPVYLLCTSGDLGYTEPDQSVEAFWKENDWHLSQARRNLKGMVRLLPHEIPDDLATQYNIPPKLGYLNSESVVAARA